MKAAVNIEYGPPEVLNIQQVEKPTPQSDELLIKIHATTVNRTDCAILYAKPFIMRFVTGLFKPKNAIQGTDFAGEIVGVGKEVKNFKVGERVFGFNDVGLKSHAEFVTMASSANFIRMPDNVSYEEAVACAEGFHYAYNFFNKVTIRPGQRILVNGATGAIGSALVQLLKHHQAEVTAVASSENKDLVKSLGANQFIDYHKEDFTARAEKFDMVLDAVGKSSFGQCRRILNPDGIYCSSELGPMAQNLFYALLAPILSKLPGMQGKKVIFPIPANVKQSLEAVKEMIKTGNFMAVIDKRYRLEEIADAYRYVDSGKKTGNVIITMD